MKLDELKDKKVAVVGMGVNNQHLAEYLKSHGINFQIIDSWRTPDDLVGKLDQFEIIFRTPGLPYLSKAVQQAKSKGVEISSQTKLFFDLCPVQIIGVTGTKGKGTTSTLIAKILKGHGYGWRVWLGGNIGKDPFEFLDKLFEEDANQDIVVLELSSFQLQDMNRSPDIAVVLNIFPDHLNHHASLEEYHQAKANILAFQPKNSLAVLHPDLPDWFKQLGQGRKIIFKPELFSDFQTKLLGRHNVDNIAAAITVALELGCDNENILREVVSKFKPLPHRLREVRKVGDVRFIDDAFSTNIEPTMAAIDAFDEPEILIVGGHDKGLDFTPLGEKIIKSKNIKALIVIGQVAPKIKDSVKGFKGKILQGEGKLKNILQQALSIAEAGDVIIFSPATSSFDMFKNESDRGDQFVKLVQDL